MSEDSAPRRRDDPRIAGILMAGTYLSGAVGLATGFATLASAPPSLNAATVLAVGLPGVLSFLRHSVFHRADAVRMGWDLGSRNNFQIEVGLANLAWGAVALVAAGLGWALQAQATLFLVFGAYLSAVAVMLVASRPDDGTARPWGPTIAMGAFAVMLLVVGVLGVRAG